MSEAELLVSWIEGDNRNISSQTKNGTAHKISLVMQPFALSKGMLVPGKLERIAAATVHDSVQVLPSGSVLIDAGENLIFRKSPGEEITKSIADVCGPDAAQPNGTYFDAELYPTSDEVGLVKLEWRTQILSAQEDDDGIPSAPRRTPQRNFLCWFKPDDLSPLATARPAKSFPGGSAAKFSLYSGPPGFTVEMTPDAVRNVVMPECKHGALLDWRQPYLLRSGNGVATVCEGELILQSGEAAKKIKLPTGSSLPIIKTDAWTSPVLLLTAGRVRLTSNAVWEQKTVYFLVNYETGKVMALPTSTSENHGSLFIPLPPVAALSNNADMMAVVEGRQLLVYETHLQGTGRLPN